MRLREHLTYANVAATLALAGVIGGGGAYATGFIDSGDIVNNSIKSKDLKNRQAVANRDVRRNALTGRVIKEHTLDAAEFAPVAGSTGGPCDPTESTFVTCAATTVRLRSAGRLLVIATGDFFGDGMDARLECRIFLDGDNTGVGAAPGEAGEPNTALNATDGFAETHVTPRLPKGPHTVALRCEQGGTADAQLGGASIAVLGISE